MSKAPTFAELEDEYARLWATIELKPSKLADIEETAGKIMTAKNGRYAAVAAATGVPWFVVGLLHAMESSCAFNKHLHNGDPLTAKTVQVPKGRPAGKPPFTWKESAIDAIRYDGLDKVKEWSIERICYELESFNGFGHRLYHKAVLTPYLWSGTNHYARGKYASDGKWNPTLVSGQSGAMALLKRLMELDPSIADELNHFEPAEPIAVAEEIGFVKARADTRPIFSIAAQSRSVWGLLVAAWTFAATWLTNLSRWIIDAIGDLIGSFGEIKDDVSSFVGTAKEVTAWFSVNWESIATVIVLICILIAIVRHTNDKRALA